MVLLVEKSLDCEVGEKVKNWRLERGYTQKDLAEKIGVKYWVILQYEKGNRRISIERLYAIAEALSISITDLIPVSKSCLEDEEEEILNLVREYKKINDQELRRMFCLLTQFVQVSEKSSRKAEKIKIAKGLVKAGISVDVVSKTIGLFADECVEEKTGSIYYQIGKKIREWRLVREYTQKDLAEKMDTTRDEISNYEQGRVATPLGKLYEIAETLSISITDLLTEEDEGSKVENELPNLIKEYKEIESQELRHALIKSLFEGIRICEEKVREIERIKVAKDLVKGGISIDTILQAVGLSIDMVLDG
ncbi:helix-turn-helix domain-containing protein [Wolbachia endosymbiont of Diaphorina citri]|uniref:WO male-killing family protein Wmk n=1 Tax=Wolbachia endosymbiont of Diaphorina citri TaxID=116598 RepID=UPI00155E77BB|nr:helix-turn-helix domain-containing protein [Wolbachia endosymbiont of Diaphorina citri]QJT94781.1 helix-turn-helix domain-containing protein [Wolbachia endosymbiont of Diaphorina citri]QJT96101.1 helix-turn-helix domain-containing protein [Wolbachia endosymbiont of Diaphorina citri]QJT97462.1 helix-turn-helix domain-containing protein [Wolbachia endosymbiont of Diaphorina citri]QXY86707.1 helix-turn-helix domain-containing protein [Wolbachia endosymbiont of Diaphorina citri]QXY87922.1 helix